ELEHRTALVHFSQRLALRQVLRACEVLLEGLPDHGVRPPSRRHEVPTRILDEDIYPVGGFTSISNRGTIESLLHSQLAYMEPDAEPPDLFDVKFLRDELLYYARDENQFLRRRRTFVFVLGPDLVATRFRDAELPYHPGVLMLALVLVVVRKLVEWLSTDALIFRLVFLGKEDGHPLTPERELLEGLLRELIANETVRVSFDQWERLPERCREWSRRSLVHVLVVGEEPVRLEAEDTHAARLRIDGPRPALDDEYRELEEVEADDAFESWSRALEEVLTRWV